MVVRVSQEAYVGAQQGVQCVSAGHWSRSFQASFCDSSECIDHRSKKTSRTNECDGREREEMLKDDLERNVTLYLHDSFCRNRETSVDPLTCCKQRVENQKCWRTASNSVRIATDVLQDTETKSGESMAHEEEMEHRQIAEKQDSKKF